MLELRSLTAGYGEKTVLRRLSMTVQPGRVTVVTGPNGCGKSTLLKVIAGLLKSSEGSILKTGKELDALSARERAQLVSYLPQERQIPDITVLRMVLHGRFPYLDYPRRYREEDLRVARDAMKRMGIEDLEDTPVGTLSGGMRQKVYIAMALAQDTPVILLDEPTTFLDVSHRLQMMQTAQELAREGKTVLMVLHDLTLALQYSDAVAVMENGVIVQTGTPEQVFSSGCIDRVFGVSLRWFETQQGTRYYIEPKERE